MSIRVEGESSAVGGPRLLNIDTHNLALTARRAGIDSAAVWRWDAATASLRKGLSRLKIVFVLVGHRERREGKHDGKKGFGIHFECVAV